jgi:hypothetical protein
MEIADRSHRAERDRGSKRTLSVTRATVKTVTSDNSHPVSWTVLAVRVPAEPSRHRVAVWRELRRSGALSLGQGVWALPATPAFERGLERAVALIDRGGGNALLLDARGRDTAQSETLEALFTTAREDEWTEFLAECAKYEAELDRELAHEKFTLAELDEEEQSLERLRRWHRDLKLRDLFGAPSANAADRQLKHCQARLEDFAEHVYAVLHGH